MGWSIRSWEKYARFSEERDLQRKNYQEEDLSLFFMEVLNQLDITAKVIGKLNL